MAGACDLTYQPVLSNVAWDTISFYVVITSVDQLSEVGLLSCYSLKNVSGELVLYCYELFHCTLIMGLFPDVFALAFIACLFIILFCC
jgi:hypothetical protein